MYLGFYVGALANLAEIHDLLSPLPRATAVFEFSSLRLPSSFLCAPSFSAPGSSTHRIPRKIPQALAGSAFFDVLWSLSPFLLLHHINFGLALACTTLLVYSPFAQRSLVLMGGGSDKNLRLSPALR